MEATTETESNAVHRVVPRALPRVAEESTGYEGVRSAASSNEWFNIVVGDQVVYAGTASLPSATYGYDLTAEFLHKRDLKAQVEFARQDIQRTALVRSIFSSQFTKDEEDSAPSAQAVREAAAIINNLPANALIPKFSWARDGEIIFEWRRPDRYVEFSIRGDGYAYGYVRPAPEFRADREEVNEAAEILLHSLPHKLVRLIPTS